MQKIPQRTELNLPAVTFLTVGARPQADERVQARPETHPVALPTG
jgi:hypothetical protein